MHAIFIYGVLLITLSIEIPVRANVARRLISRKERDTSGQDVHVIETVMQEFEKDGESTVKEQEVDRERTDNRKRFLHKRDTPSKVACTSLHAPSNGVLRCGYGTTYPERIPYRNCKATCIESYKFPDGSVEKIYNCTRQGQFWNKVDQAPNCQPAREGIGCDKKLMGKNQMQICKIDSSTKRCKSGCHSGYRFPNGEREMIITCTKSTGVYEPVDKFPDCAPTGVDGEYSLPFGDE